MEWIDIKEQKPGPFDRVIALNNSFFGTDGYISKTGRVCYNPKTKAKIYPVKYWVPYQTALKESIDIVDRQPDPNELCIAFCCSGHAFVGYINGSAHIYAQTMPIKQPDIEYYAYRYRNEMCIITDEVVSWVPIQEGEPYDWNQR